GHGALSDRAAVREYRAMLGTVRDRVRGGIAGGRTLAQIVATRPTAEFDARWGSGFVKPDQFVAFVYRSLAAQRR
ncbi:MAG: MBL fold metallo-hydrolase, partial [Gemmatimonadales bacterium]